jgi:transposase
MTNRFSLRQFKYKYGTHDMCLEAIKELRFPDPYVCPKCNTEQKFYPVKGRTSYACNACGHHIYPLAGTIFEKSTTPLDLWFFAMYLMVQTRSGISAKQLERMLGVTYKTAWRMFKQIRMLMAETGGGLLDGIVEIDETFVGGKGKNRAYEWGGDKQKEILMGFIQREGKAYIKHIPNTGKYTLLRQVKENVSPTARVMTDELMSYTGLTQMGYFHQSVKHKAREYARGEVHTQSIESFWGGLKRGIYGVYRVVSKKYLQAYADEYAWRYNYRLHQGGMFELLLKQVAEVKTLKAEKLV